MAEIGRAVELVRDGLAPEGTWFSDVELVEPTRHDLERYVEGEVVDRLVRVVVVTGPSTEVTEVVVSLTADQVVSSTEVDGVCSTILDEESFYAAELLKADPRWQAAMAKRGITDFDSVVIDPWPAGRYGLEIEEGCRLARCTSYVKEAATDNMYARPVDGVIGFVDTGRRRVVRVDDHGVVPVPPVGGGYLPDDVGPLRSGLRPLEITQPEGPSFTIEGGLLLWQGWSMRVSMNAHEGLVLHTIGYEDGGRVRPILFRASIDEMIVPYGAPGPMHSWKNAFDASEWGLGKAANSLMLGCDCLGEIRYLDAAFATERGRPYRVRKCCLHPRGGHGRRLAPHRHRGRDQRGAAGPSARGQFLRHGRQLRLRLLLVLLPGRHHRVRGETDRDRLDRGRGRRSSVDPRHPCQRAPGRPQPPAHLQRPASF